MIELDKLMPQYRDIAVRDLVPYIEASKPYHRNDGLATKFYDFMLQVINSADDINDRIMLFEDVMTTFDHDLSDYLMLAQYQINTNIVENGQDTIFSVVITCDGVSILDSRMSLSTAVLMSRKRKLELA